MAEAVVGAVSIKTLDHIVLHVNDLERSKRFYTELLGMVPYREFEGHTFMRGGSADIALFEARGGHKAEGYTEFDHIALRVEAGTEEEIKGKLKERGIELLPRGEGLGWDPTPDTGIYFQDPDGHRIQLLLPHE